ncbi:SIR2 family protein [Sphingomonas sp. S-NIH.Pt15_0812]|uniref:SIR2 family NAD-dependent protein deacylase n=1 Tax=Sphingomonas sp. S-NIH.Pt15_0812 TaxID=1920129 RepID=UPI000F7F0749|nr:SIR2 family protein [Sphingomonas sp. S-NIH.Pt15_0812]RSU51068.1 hypothetical protein BRX43_07085 [Sphingomonas sp. S-NIH.Pt15_0812]
MRAGEQEPSIVTDIATLLAGYKLVPFIGAGVSRRHLGLAGAELAQAFASEIGEPPETPLATVSDLYAERRGADAFIAFLRERLLVEALDEQKASGHRLLLSLGPGIVYTTNQDNIFELTAEKFGRRYRKVVTIDDLSAAIPGEPLLIKFHGDLDVPESLVFGDQSYRSRMAVTDHPLDIRLRADLLGKRLLFIGYSLRDENIVKLLNAVRKAFGGELPQSYLLAFDANPELADTANAFGIKLVVPRDLYPDAADSAAAFERCLVAICNATRKLQAEAGLQNLVADAPINPRMLTDYEFDALEASIASGSFASALNAFRGTLDATVVPEYLHERVARAFGNLVELARPHEEQEMRSLNGALFNLYLPTGHAAQATATLLAHYNQQPPRQGFDPFAKVICPAMPDETMPVAAAIAVMILRDRGEAITSSFRDLARFWFRGWEKLPDNLRDTTKQMIEVAWPGSLASESPVNRPLYTPSGLGGGFHAIRDQLMAQFPKQLLRPGD